MFLTTYAHYHIYDLLQYDAKFKIQKLVPRNYAGQQNEKNGVQLHQIHFHTT